jgi:methanogenic corrinoid protein MtbC1
MVAQAIGVSESSLKRWCDQGRLETIRTAGGHRRLTRGEVVRFTRESNMSIASPEAIGLPKMDSDAIHNDQYATENIKTALLSADEATVRQLLLTMFVSGWRLHRIFDDVIAKVFGSIGDLWSCNSVEIYKERLSCEITQNVLRELRTLLPKPEIGAPVALGAALEGDHYTMPSLMVEMIMLANGWKAHSLGPNLPFSTLLAAVKDHDPKLFWISISHLEPRDDFVEQFNDFSAKLPRSTALAIGGNAITPELRKVLKFTVCCDNMRQFENYATNINALTHRDFPKISQ